MFARLGAMDQHAEDDDVDNRCSAPKCKVLFQATASDAKKDPSE